MAKYCGGINLNPTEFKLIDGVVTLEDETSVVVEDAISVCGQLWDGEYFKVVAVDGRPCITIDGDVDLLNDPVIVRGNCGIGLDGRILMCRDGEVSFIDGYTVKVITDPDTAIVTVLNENSEEIEPITEGSKEYFLTDIGKSYSVTVQKAGYTGKSQTIKNYGNRTIIVELEEIPQS